MLHIFFNPCTGGGCHLDAGMVKSAMDQLLDLDGVDLLVVENVGSLIGPAEFAIGEYMKIAVLSTTEGNGKPLKCPLLLEHTNFNRQEFYDDIASIWLKSKVKAK